MTSVPADWFENDGKGKFTTHIIHDDQAAYDIRLVDMDADGDLDTLIAALTHTYDGTEKLASVTTTPSGLTVDLTYSQGATLVAPIAAVAAVAAVAGVLYVAGDTLPEGKVVGDVKTAAVAAVTGVTGPSDAGTYTVTATVDDANYEGSKVAILTISASDGQGSRLIQKGALQPLTLAEMSNNPFSFSYDTEEGETYKVECSTDLIRWYEVDLVKGTGSEVKFTDKRQRLFRQQFYRVVLE
ncbi:MBG domain-containing protein [bacterium]|nr:MBG domain-containing protein [bacterium]